MTQCKDDNCPFFKKAEPKPAIKDPYAFDVVNEDHFHQAVS